MSRAQAITALKAALRSRLLARSAVTAIVGQAVYETQPRDANAPLILFGEAVTRENGTVEAEGHVIDLDIVAMTRERGVQQGLVLADKIQTALEDAPIPLAGFQLSLLLVREVLTRHERANTLSRVALRLRAFLHTSSAP